MRKLFAAFALVVPGLLVVPLAASAASSPAQIVTCAGSPPWCFSPNPIRITAGSTVTWTNATALTHTATSDTGAWTTGNIAPGSTSGAVSFPTAGTFTYHCAIHSSMTGSVIVSAAVPVPTSPPLRGLAPGGGGPQLPIGAALLLLGFGLLVARGIRRDRPQRVRERIDKLPHE
ncbi:MAG TPA: plastocyanin/azurin family copper-binding protein [Candidatus Dormibacteraeota bacterium]|nr:plastocyanin/azurin family copper-binding protein [Candidatus Dormibacteraeota bacterium]